MSKVHASVVPEKGIGIIVSITIIKSHSQQVRNHAHAENLEYKVPPRPFYGRLIMGDAGRADGAPGSLPMPGDS